MAKAKTTVRKKRKKKKDKAISLAPLSYEEAVRALLNAPPKDKQRP